MTSGNKSSRQDNSFIKSGPSLVGLTSDERSSDGKYEDRRGKGMPINKEDIAAWEEALDSLEDFEEQQERAIERQLSHQSNWNEGGDQQTKDPAMHAEGYSPYPPPPPYQRLVNSSKEGSNKEKKMNNEANFVPSGSGQQQNEKIDDNSGSPSEQLEDNDDESEEKNTSESDSMDHYMDDIRDHEIHKKETGGQESGPEIENVAKDNAESTFVNEPPNIEQLLKPLDKQESIISRPATSKPKIQIDSSAKRYPVSEDLKILFEQAQSFSADKIKIQPVFKPFPQSYIPAVGDVDPFIKITRPDDLASSLDYFDGLFLQIDTSKLLRPDDLQLGLVVLDEPAANQSDPAVMDLKLHQSGKTSSSKTPVKKLGRLGGKDSEQIDKWIRDVREIRRSKPHDRIHYTRKMPDIEVLMQEWPRDVEKSLEGIQEYVDLCLSLVDIPVYKSRLEALHLLFSLFYEFKNSQHFQSIQNEKQIANGAV